MPKATLRLSRDFIKQSASSLRVRQTAEVAVPEFGPDMTVNVKGLTVADKNLIGRLVAAGHPDASCIVAALCAVGDDGRLVFGDTAAQAVAFVSELPETYRFAVSRIVVEAMRLSGRLAEDGAEIAEETAVDEAEKN